MYIKQRERERKEEDWEMNVLFRLDGYCCCINLIYCYFKACETKRRLFSSSSSRFLLSFLLLCLSSTSFFSLVFGIVCTHISHNREYKQACQFNITPHDRHHHRVKVLNSWHSSLSYTRTHLKFTTAIE